MNQYVIISLLIVIVMLFGCASPLSIERLTDSAIGTGEKTLTLITSTRYDFEIRKVLAREGFQVKKFKSRIEVEELVGPTKIERYSESEARYGVSVYPGEKGDFCTINNAVKYGIFSLEITDMQSGDVILVVEKGGWTKDCGPFRKGTLFSDLARALGTILNSRNQ